ncbi:hypothetical protein HH214_01475 [Mucilaginibacter robiniae]|uniref:Uncharacterized protein n=1 Tax=Mucilaginibacter robiniae TaxID=2728022 RepID=A0A7L5DUA1_9SPHI|nr:hypothetical protein [Mucilaginibacter robiniae]QJD94632.1 hypothetical protein HH214_01475 [Mucilaginibacter robiniae]
MDIYDYIMASIDSEVFIKSTILIKGADIIKMSPRANEEIIASTLPGGAIGDHCKYFRVSESYVKWDLSYANYCMYLATIPNY